MRGLLALFFALFAAPVFAHPHIFIDAKAVIVFDDGGNIIEVKNTWTFDEAFSVWQTQGLDTNGDGVTSSEEMQELADENLVGLSEYGFYTFMGEGSETLPLTPSGPARFVYENNRSTYTFAVAPTEPYRINDALEVAINDPEYYVAITVGAVSDVMLENAPAECQVRLEPPQTMSDDLAGRLYSLGPDVVELPPDLAAELRGVQGAIIVTCPGLAQTSVPATAVDAVTEVAKASPTPFGGPPPEPGFVMPRTGFLGWIAEQQQEFYRAMTTALGALRQDNNAFWVLGSLSFLYGVFHAAGPGHGKVVISSYVLANERQIRQGIFLSFLSAMLQSAVAIALVLIAVAALNLTAAAMNDAAHWIGVASYALVALLGLWLVGRKLFAGRGETAHEDEHYHAEHNHHDDHDHHSHAHHHHIVTPDAAAGGWREQLGVVLAVGLRPCSGALIVLAFALSQGVVAAGIVAVLLMGLGTALTVAVLAGLAVGLKGVVLRGAGSGALTTGIVWWAELLGAVLVFGFGALLLVASL